MIDDELRPGLRVTPTVRLVRKLGQGGMGSVWVADHLALHSKVVVKFMARALVSDAAQVARFSREAAVAASVKSQHVVQTFDHGVMAGGIPFIVMEMLEGEDLGQRLHRCTRLAPREVVAIVAQAAKALVVAHKRGIVHRDIKPENIFLCESDGECIVKLLDFGIAKGGDQPSVATTTGAMMGTGYYMSPEQLVSAKGVDHRTDLWALGIVTFQALTGARPFDGETFAALAIAIHSQTMPRPSTFHAKLPATVDRWFEKACARDPAARFQSAKEMAVALGEALGVQVAQTDLRPFVAPPPAAPSDTMRALSPAFGAPVSPKQAPAAVSPAPPPAPAQETAAPVTAQQGRAPTGPAADAAMQAVRPETLDTVGPGGPIRARRARVAVGVVLALVAGLLVAALAVSRRSPSASVGRASEPSAPPSSASPPLPTEPTPPAPSSFGSSITSPTAPAASAAPSIVPSAPSATSAKSAPSAKVPAAGPGMPKVVIPPKPGEKKKSDVDI